MSKVHTIEVKSRDADGEHHVDKIHISFTEQVSGRLTLDKYRDYFEEIRTDNDVGVEVN